MSNTDEIVNFASNNKNKARIHTFGIGNHCDKNLVERIAAAGRGSSSFAGDSDSNISGIVVEALRRSFEPSLAGCVFEWP